MGTAATLESLLILMSRALRATLSRTIQFMITRMVSWPVSRRTIRYSEIRSLETHFPSALAQPKLESSYKEYQRLTLPAISYSTIQPEFGTSRPAQGTRAGI